MLLSRSASSSTRSAAREPLAPLRGERRAVEAPGLPSPVQVEQRFAHGVHVVGCDDDVRLPCRARAPRRRRRAARPRGSAARRRGTRRSSRSGRPCRGHPTRGSGGAAPRSPAAARASGGARRSRAARCGRRGRATPRTRGRRRGSRPAKRATTSVEAGSASARRNGFGSRLPRNCARVRDPEPVAAVVLEPGEVVEVGSRSRSSRPCPSARSARISSAIASDDRDDRVRRDAPRAPRPRPWSSPSPARRAATRSRAGAGCEASGSRRSATQRAPVARLTAAPSEMERRRRRGREHDVDPLAPRRCRIATGSRACSR